ncbi:MAG TPA: CRISPR-associated endonuclease Cas2 [Clostridiales bacterium]|nr:CRISPR-associated endonuclease Cas2 [Clostridiales bacterium]
MVISSSVNFGQRVQNSVFECLVDPAQFQKLKWNLLRIMDPEKDSIRFYFLGSSYRTKIEHHGAKAGYDPEGVLMV